MKRPMVRMLVLILCILSWPDRAYPNESLSGVALVIGQKNYATLPELPNTLRDADDIKRLLEKLGFKVDLASDKSGRQLQRWIDGFIEDADGADVALVYYAGHAIEAGGVNYLVPIDADEASLAQAGENLISLQHVLDRLRSKAKVTLLLLDACRSNPFPATSVVKTEPSAAGKPISAGGLAVPRGVALIEDGAMAPESLGEVVGYAAAPGQVALDGPADGNSPYAAALLKHLSANQGYDFGQVMTLVSEEVYLKTGSRQRPWVNASLRRFMVFGGAAEESSSDEAIIAGERRKLLLSIAATPESTRSLIETIAKDQALPLDPLYGMLRELRVDTSAGPRNLARQIQAGAENLKLILAEKVSPLRHDPELSRLAGLADKAQAEGAIGLAKQYRARAAKRADRLKSTLDQREAELNADRLELAVTYAEYAGTAVLAFDYETAVEQYAKAYKLVEGHNLKRTVDYRLGEARALMGQGGEPHLRRAVQITRTVLNQFSRESDPFGWAALQETLGNALIDLAGYSNNDPNMLDEAVRAYQAALGEYTRERAPQNWAVIQNNMGVALSDLGDRKDDPALKRKALAAYREALTVQSREDAPLSWARSQNNLGIALAQSGRRTADVQLLQEAVSAYEAALTERTRARLPYYWAATQHNLGNALLSIGQLENDRSNLIDAAAAYQSALEVRVRSKFPKEWEVTWHGLGLALVELTDRGDYATFLKVAKTAQFSDLATLISGEARELMEDAD